MTCKISAFLILSTFLIQVNCSETIDNHPNWKYFSLEDCGQTIYQPITGKIVGGKKSKIGQFPWIVRLGLFEDHYQKEPFFVCAGTLITPKYVITAGHCGTDNTIARLGEYDSTQELDCDENKKYCSTYQDIQIAEYVFNLYDSDTSQRDICLIRLEKEADINEFVRPICLPQGHLVNEDLTGKKVQIAGWGYVDSDTYTTATTLMYVSLPIINKSECDAIYQHSLTSSQLCIGTTGKDSCNGDSGGAATKLRKRHHKHRYYIIGIVSYGKRDCGKGPAVYTDVSKYLKNILDAITQ